MHRPKIIFKTSNILKKTLQKIIGQKMLYLLYFQILFELTFSNLYVTFT